MAETVGTLAADLTFRTQFATLQKDLAQVKQMITSAAEQTAKITKKGLDDTTKATKSVYKGLSGIKTGFKDIGRVAAGILMARAINSVGKRVEECTR